MKLDDKDVRSIVRLLGEVVALPGGHAEKKRALMNGLCRLISADAWVWGLSCRSEPDKPQIYVSFIKGGFTEPAFAKYLEALEHPQMVRFASKFFTELEEKKSHLTRLRHQITDDSGFEGSEAHALWKAADIGSLIVSQRPLDERSGSALGLYRRFKRPKFTSRESRIAHIVLTEVPWLHEQGWPEDRGAKVPSLSKRQRIALNLLITGQGQKQIASEMGISIHTLQGYIKEIYRYFSVRSQGELMHRFYEGNGRDLM